MNATNRRLSSIDVVRGLVMIIMVLDHVRDLFHVHSLDQDPTNMLTTTPALFFTRWVTHFCAPIFVFLAGTSAAFSLQSSSDKKASSRFLIKRGLWLLLLEFTVVNFGIWFDIRFGVLLFQVIGAIGLGLLVVGLLYRVHTKIMVSVGMAIICLYGFLPPNVPLFTVTVVPSSFTTLIVGYPPIPWIAILLVGYGSAQWMWKEAGRNRRLWLTGVVCLFLFVGLRWLNVYGDIAPWQPQKDALYTFMSFLNVSKYPPSLLFCLLTLGIMFLLLSIAERSNGFIAKVLVVYGRVPLFFYLIHWYIIHLLLFLVLYEQGFRWPDLVFGTRFGRPMAVSGFELPGVYIVWFCVVGLLYPLCARYGRYKFGATRPWTRFV